MPVAFDEMNYIPAYFAKAGKLIVIYSGVYYLEIAPGSIPE